MLLLGEGDSLLLGSVGSLLETLLYGLVMLLLLPGKLELNACRSTKVSLARGVNGLLFVLFKVEVMLLL